MEGKSYSQIENLIGCSRHTISKVSKSMKVVFNIKVNDYRLIVAIAYQRGWMFVKFIGTHKEYEKIDAETVNLE